MDLSHPAESDRFRGDVRDFLRAELPAGWKGPGTLDHDELEVFEAGWRKKLHDHGLLGLAWPKAWGGRGLTPLEEIIVHEEFSKVAAPLGVPNDMFGINMLGPTLMQWGTEEQKRHFIPRILSGVDVWCQGYSEPNAGSDLANLSCRAELVGDEWVIHGQKIWTSYGHLANWIFLLARTDRTDRKQAGITFLLVPMDQPGIEVVPIQMISGRPEFNEVFFDGARTPAANVVGEIHGGWPVAMSLLGFERGQDAATVHMRFRQELDRLLELARQNGRADDPVVRQRLASCHTKVEIMRFLGLRLLTSYLAGVDGGPTAAVFKLYWSEYHQQVTELAVDVLGAAGLVIEGRLPSSVAGPDDAGTDPHRSATWLGSFFNARAGTIYSGTSQVQRNIIGERILGLPKEPAPR